MTVVLLAALLTLPIQASDADSTLFPGAKADTVAVPANTGQRLTCFAAGAGAGVDTLDIEDGRLLLILKDDHTWELVRNIQYDPDGIFRDHWNEQVVNPFHDVRRQDLPYRTILCLADSLGGFACPYQSKVFSRFGVRRGRNHNGCDLPYPKGTPVRCAFDGRVRVSMPCRGYGQLVVVRHANGLETYYGHLSRRDVTAGQWIHAGDTLGLGGSTGRSTGPHLHFETRVQGHAFDPEWIIDFENGRLRKNVFVLKRTFLSNHSRYVPSSIDEEEEIYMSEEQIKAEEARIAEEEARRARELAAARYHTIRSGDTLSGLAAKYHTTIRKICSLNNGLTPKTTLKLGRKVRVN
ncbi:MAG: peptidoglycan DD-metalloendopeptidase family protein [Bacteroidales bacterium]|nr:peptidoglycan DD-metalloendopeptidase family protein [Bacteroidales bacterium]